MGIDAEMLVRTRYDFNEEELKNWRFELHDAFSSAVWASRKWNTRALAEIDVYEQDGPDVHPEPGERFLSVALSGRYYGPAYERGPLPDFIAIAEWLERRIPEAVVWYGGDSSGVAIRPFGKAEREHLFAHFVQHGHLPYGGDPRKGETDKLARFAGEELPTPPVCDFCGIPMRRYMWGGKFSSAAGYSCVGCDSAVTTEDGETFVAKDAD